MYNEFHCYVFWYAREFGIVVSPCSEQITTHPLYSAIISSLVPLIIVISMYIVESSKQNYQIQTLTILYKKVRGNKCIKAMYSYVWQWKTTSVVSTTKFARNALQILHRVRFICEEYPTNNLSLTPGKDFGTGVSDFFQRTNLSHITVIPNQEQHIYIRGTVIKAAAAAARLLQPKPGCTTWNNRKHNLSSKFTS